MRSPSFSPLEALRRWRPWPARARKPAAAALLAPASVWSSHPFRLVLAASGLLIAVIVMAAWMLLANLRSEQIAKGERDLESLTTLLAEQIDRSFQSIELVQTSVLDRIKSFGIRSPEELELTMSGYDTYQGLKDRIGALPHIDAMVLTAPNGKLINFSRGWPVPRIDGVKSDRAEIFKSTHLASFIGKPLRSPTKGTWVLPIVRKVTSADGTFIGILIGTMRLSYFEELFKSVARNHDRSISLFTGSGTLVARYPRDDALRGRSFARRAIFTDILLKGRHRNGPASQLDQRQGTADFRPQPLPLPDGRRDDQEGRRRARRLVGRGSLRRRRRRHHRAHDRRSRLPGRAPCREPPEDAEPPARRRAQQHVAGADNVRRLRASDRLQRALSQDVQHVGRGGEARLHAGRAVAASDRKRHA